MTHHGYHAPPPPAEAVVAPDKALALARSLESKTAVAPEGGGVVPPKAARAIHEMEKPPVKIALTAQAHGIDLATDAPSLELEDDLTYTVHAIGSRSLNQAIVAQPSPPSVQIPASARQYLKGQSFASSPPATPQLLTSVLIAFENVDTHALTLRVLDEHPVVVEHTTLLYAFHLTDRSESDLGDSMKVVVIPKLYGESAMLTLTPAALYVEDTQRFLVRVLEPNRAYALGLEAPAGTLSACVAASPGGFRTKTPVIVGQHAMGSLYLLAPGSYTLRGAASLWCTLPHLGGSSAEVRMTLGARR